MVTLASWVGRPFPRAAGRSTNAELAATWATGALVFVLWALWQGRDLGFDALNHHLYLGAAADGARVRRDFMAAGLQSYQAPYAYWPLTTMALAGWSSAAVLTVLALVQSLIVPALWWVSIGLFPGEALVERARRIGAVLLGLTSVVVLGQIGSTFADLTVAVPVVLACGLALRASREGAAAWRAAAAAGAVAGLATALKLTSAPFAIALVVPILFAATTVARRVVAAMAMGAACGAAFALAYAPWGWALWTTRGNPVFPFFNGLFRSPDFPLEGIAHLRYLPADWVEALARPIAMLDPQANVYYEIIAPDARPFALLVGCGFVGWRLARSWSCPDALKRAAPLLAYLAAVWAAWLATTGNGRYFIPALVLLGPALVAVVGTGLVPRAVMLAAALLPPFQLAQAMSMQPSMRWDPRTANDPRAPFLEIHLPPRFARRPATFVMASGQSYSFLSLGTHPASTWLTIGGWPMTPEGPGSGSLLAKLRAARDLVVVVPTGYRAGALEPQVPEIRPESLGALLPYGIEVTGECELERRTAAAIFPPAPAGSPAQLDHLAGFWFCSARFSDAVRSAALDAQAQDPRRARAGEAFDRIEDACPAVLRPARQHTEQRGSGFQRQYPSTDARLYLYGRERIALWVYGVRDPLEIGSVDQVLASEPTALESCARLPARYVLPWRRS